MSELRRYPGVMHSDHSEPMRHIDAEFRQYVYQLHEIPALDSAETERLITCSQAGLLPEPSPEQLQAATDAKDKIVYHHLPLIGSISLKFATLPTGVERFDLFQEGCIAVMQAVDNYTFGGEAQFSTYAYRCAWGQMSTFLSDKGRLIHVPRNRSAAMRRSVRENNGDLSALSPEERRIFSLEHPNHLEARISSEDSRTFEDVLGDDGLERYSQQRERQLIVAQQIKTLTPKVTEAVVLSYGLADEVSRTAEEVAQITGTSRSAIAMRLTDARRRLATSPDLQELYNEL